MICIIPLGAKEYHGPHLPLETDAIIADAFAKQISTHHAKQAHIKLTPVEAIGYSVEHLGANGTQSLSFDEAIKRWISLGENAYQAGIKKILFLNAHGGNSAIMSIVITELRMRHKMLAAATSWSRFGLPNGLISQDDKHLDIHGGFIETSLMLHLAPEKVQLELAEHYTNQQENFIKKYQHLRAYGPHAFGWKMCDINKKGAAGNALNANPKAGQAIFDHAYIGLSQLIDDIYQFDITTLC